MRIDATKLQMYLIDWFKGVFLALVGKRYSNAGRSYSAGSATRPNPPAGKAHPDSPWWPASSPWSRRWSSPSAPPRTRPRCSRTTSTTATPTAGAPRAAPGRCRPASIRSRAAAPAPRHWPVPRRGPPPRCRRGYGPTPSAARPRAGSASRPARRARRTSTRSCSRRTSVQIRKGATTTLASASFSTATGTWYTLSLSANGASLVGFGQRDPGGVHLGQLVRHRTRRARGQLHRGFLRRCPGDRRGRPEPDHHGPGHLAAHLADHATDDHHRRRPRPRRPPTRRSRRAGSSAGPRRAVAPPAVRAGRRSP